MRPRPQAHTSNSGMSGIRGGARAEHLPEATHRSSLFGTSLGGRGGVESGVGSVSSSMQQALEEDNNSLTDDLQQKVSALRYASQTIHDEVAEQNKLLSGMGLDFEKTGGLMGTALTRLDGLLRQGRQGHMCYIVLFSLVIFLALYWIMSKR